MNNLERMAKEAMEKARLAQEEAERARAKERAQRERKARSQAARAKTLEAYVEDRLLKGTLKPKLVQAYLGTQSKPTWSYLDLAYRLLSDPVYGLHRGPYGEFIFQNQRHESPKDIQRSIERYLGESPKPVAWIDNFMRDVLTGTNDNPGGNIIWETANQETRLEIPTEELEIQDELQLRAILDLDPLGDSNPDPGMENILSGENQEAA